MTEFTIASFNVKNLIEADHEYYKYEAYTPRRTPLETVMVGQSDVDAER